jgi:hypothetical protein
MHTREDQRTASTAPARSLPLLMLWLALATPGCSGGQSPAEHCTAVCEDQVAGGCEDEDTECAAQCRAFVDTAEQLDCDGALGDVFDCVDELSDVCSEDSEICLGPLETCVEIYCADHPGAPMC